MKVAYLVQVTNMNNNKYYEMREVGDGTFEVTYGRIGVTATKKIYPMSKWYSIYQQKLNKGYVDQTSIHETLVPVKTKDTYMPIKDKNIADLIAFLREKARETVHSNYTVRTEAVTEAMVRSAQRILDSLSTSVLIPVPEFNDQLLSLFTTIPRRMNKVPDYLAKSRDDYEKIIHREQSLLDVMAGQITEPLAAVRLEGDDSMTILDAFGLKFSPTTERDIAIIKKELGPECAPYFYKAWRVENQATQKQFKEFVKEKGRIKKKLFWHGSRTENWWSILRTGLVLRPTNAIINGKMFGYGLYFAPKAQKSMGYTSLRGAHWTRGSSRFGFMALYEVVYGKPYDVFDAAPNMNYQMLQRVAPGCSCLHAHAGSALRNDEIVVYREDQTTIKYLVELKSN